MGVGQRYNSVSVLFVILVVSSSLNLSYSLFILPLLPPWRGIRQLFHIGPIGYWLDRIKYQLHYYDDDQILYLKIPSPTTTTNNKNNNHHPLPKFVTATNLPPKSSSSFVRIMFVSDTHGKHVCLSNRIPSSSSIDIMIHCGDVTLSYGYSKKNKDNYKQQRKVWDDFDVWCGRMKVEKGISEIFVLFGNHDSIGEMNDNNNENQSLVALQNAKLIHDGNFIQTKNGNLKLFGSSFSPPGVTCNNAFQNVEMLQHHLEKANNNNENKKLDILITHGPSYEMQQLAESLNVPIWVYGHFHDGYGINTIQKKGKKKNKTEENTTNATDDNILYTINAASCDMIYRPVNPPIIVDYIRFNDEE